MFRNPFSFEGRIRRAEYGISLIIFLFTASIAHFIAASNHMFLLFLYIPQLWFIWAQGAKRCHDRNNNGWYQLLPFYGFWMLFADGDAQSNRYGANPKQIDPLKADDGLLDEFFVKSA